MKLIYVVMFFLTISLANAEDIEEKCTSSSCAVVLCLAPPPKCPKGTILKPGGYCNCCNVCKTLIYEGGNCTAESPIAGRTSDKVVCADGLQCIGGVCKKWNPGQNC
ncbi:serine protease HTRA3-like isoform X2 [Harmonia axyridis]|uniref:serine protease HTRA3-like isoform X2 n=1 Tax=Harmonia axyridis TaxID=115357 RepID=UPI001E277BB7|nr:serine protease HTRA3-like isoform X2 [Harmonia axyridis]